MPSAMGGIHFSIPEPCYLFSPIENIWTHHLASGLIHSCVSAIAMERTSSAEPLTPRRRRMEMADRIYR
jgi:hypothetical protein